MRQQEEQHPTPQQPQKKDPDPDRSKPKDSIQGNPCKTFADDRAARAGIENAHKATDVAGIASDAARLTLVARNTISGRISYTGFDGVQRSFATDTGTQRSYLLDREGGAFGVFRAAGNLFALYGAANGLSNIRAGYLSGNSETAFGGGMALAGVFVGILDPAAGIGMGLAIIGDSLFGSEKPSLLSNMICTPAR